jgi:hypothetical protein
MTQLPLQVKRTVSCVLLGVWNLLECLVEVTFFCVKRVRVSVLYQYCTFDLEILMRSKIPSLAKMKCICAWKFVCSSYIGGDISVQNYLEDTISLNKLRHSHSKIFKNYITKSM